MNNFIKTDSFANRLKLALDNAGKKPADVVKETGIDKSAMSNYRKGTYEPKQDAIYKIAKCLNVSEMWLWGYDCPMERPISQKENDELVELIEKLRNDKGFRSLVIKLGKLNPDQLEGLMKLMNIPLT